MSGKNLPEWGFNQLEVATDRVIKQDATIWNVEEHRYTRSKYTQTRNIPTCTSEIRTKLTDQTC